MGCGVCKTRITSMIEACTIRASTCFDDEADIARHACSMLVFHPGYLDQYVLDHSSFTLIRPMETAFLVSEELEQWIEQKHVQLVNFENYCED